MECPICSAELENNGVYGYLAQHQSGEILGNNYKCPNSEGFESEEDSLLFLLETNQTLDSIGVSCLEEVTCDSSMFNVAGAFYTDKQENLHEGYPC